jgi:TonB family protein
MKAIVDRQTPRVGFLLSIAAHILLMILLLHVPVLRPLILSHPPEPPVEARPVVVVPMELLRPAPHPQRDRISVGGPSPLRQKGPLELKRDEELTALVAKGVPNPGETLELPGAPSPSEPLPPPAGIDPWVSPPASPSGPRRAGLGETLRDLDRRLGAAGTLGIESGTGQQMGPLFFDPRGADFTQWYNHFRIEGYRNWMLPYAAFMYSGEVQFDFTVQRDGRVTDLHMVKSAGNPALDRSARNALIASRFLPLPADFGPPSVIMRVSFIYNTRPSGS